MDSGNTRPRRDLPGAICTYNAHTFILYLEPTFYIDRLLIKLNGLLRYKAINHL